MLKLRARVSQMQIPFVSRRQFFKKIALGGHYADAQGYSGPREFVETEVLQKIDSGVYYYQV